MRRRTAIQRGAAIGLSVFLAGCPADSDDSPATRTAETPTSGPTETPTARATGTPTETGTPTPEVIDELDSLEGSWPTFGRGNRRRNALPDGTLPETAPSRRWSISLGPIVGQPLLADGMVYAQTEAGNVYQLEGATGSVRWVYDVGLPETDGPAVERHRMAVDEERVYLVDRTRRLHAIDRETGESRWRTKVSTAETSLLFFGQAVPTIVDGRAFLAEYPGRLLGYDVETGDLVVDGSVPAAGTPFPTLAERDGSLYVASSGTGEVDDEPINPSLSKLGADGELAWTSNQTSTHMYVARSPVVDGDQVYLTDATNAYAFGTTDGERRWQSLPTSGGATEYRWYSPAVGEDRLVYTNDEIANLGAGLGSVSSATGSLAWHSYDILRSAANAPVVVGDGVVVPAGDGIYACSIADGSQRWKLDVSGEPSVVAGDGVLVTGGGGTISAWA